MHAAHLWIDKWRCSSQPRNQLGRATRAFVTQGGKTECASELFSPSVGAKGRRRMRACARTLSHARRTMHQPRAQHSGARPIPSRVRTPTRSRSQLSQLSLVVELPQPGLDVLVEDGVGVPGERLGLGGERALSLVAQTVIAHERGRGGKQPLDDGLVEPLQQHVARELLLVGHVDGGGL
eukprot:6204630-Pleurochrysis_carterae.AAC.3